jgi:enoyl-CoA hydratase
MSEAVVLTEPHGEVLLITLNRPDQRNSVNREVTLGLAAALDRLDEDPAFRVGILTGTGGFCSGMDLKAFTRGEVVHLAGRGFAGIVESPPSKPLIAAVERFAVAGGWEIALSCDLVVAAEDARFGIPEVKRGLVAIGGALLRLPKRIPYHVAMELALTGNLITARQALELGLVNRVTEQGGAVAGALALAAEIIPNAPLAVRASKDVVLRAADWSDADGFALQRTFTDAAIASEDAREGATAFAEKRDPVWTGT